MRIFLCQLNNATSYMEKFSNDVMKPTKMKGHIEKIDASEKIKDGFFHGAC